MASCRYRVFFLLVSHYTKSDTEISCISLPGRRAVPLALCKMAVPASSGCGMLFIFLLPIDPFPHIALHIVQTKPVRQFLPDGFCTLTGIFTPPGNIIQYTFFRAVQRGILPDVQWRQVIVMPRRLV